jgi:Sec-independent protein translocase protein TatA
MEFLGIGLPELIFILLLVVIIFGPKDLEKMAKKVGSAIARFIRSDTFRDLRRIGDLPTELVRKAGLDEFRADLSQLDGQKSKLPLAGQVLPPGSSNPPDPGPDNRIAPPDPGAEAPKIKDA